MIERIEAEDLARAHARDPERAVVLDGRLMRAGDLPAELERSVDKIEPTTWLWLLRVRGNRKTRGGHAPAKRGARAATKGRPRASAGSSAYYFVVADATTGKNLLVGDAHREWP